MTQCVYRQVLGPNFDVLPARVRELHDLSAPSLWRGRADVTRGTSLMARAIATVFRLPPEGRDQPIEVRFTPHSTHEVWQRIFPSGTFESRQSPNGRDIHESVGPVTLILHPTATAEGMTLAMLGVRCLGIPLPQFLVPNIATREFEQNGRYHFDVSATLPIFGPLVRYAGWLERVD